jgi:ABC-2 type transport system ATP-binding protein
MDTAALKLEGLNKYYGNFCALEDIHLEIARGEIFALLGPNGAGKTTLIGCIGGLVKKTSGKAFVFGMDLDKSATKARHEMGFVHQEINFDAVFTPREALAFQMGYYGMRKNPARIEELLEVLALSGKADVPMRTLSGGMKRRMMIAKALVHNPKLLFLDEPTAGVDMELRQDLWGYVRHLREQGTTLVLTTHYLEEAEALADRVGVLSHGRLAVVEEKNRLIARLGTKQLQLRLASPITEAELREILGGIEAGFSKAAGNPLPIRAELSKDGTQLSIFQTDKSPNFAQMVAILSTRLKMEDIQTQNPRLEDVIYKVLHDSESPAPKGC